MTKTDQSNHHKDIVVEFVLKNGTKSIYMYILSLKITKTG
jgi:hypothetical protein